MRITKGFFQRNHDYTKEAARQKMLLRTIILISHVVTIFAFIHNRQLEYGIEEAIEEDQFSFRKGRGNRDANGKPKVTGRNTNPVDR